MCNRRTEIHVHMSEDKFEGVVAEAIEEALNEYGRAVYRVIEYYLRTRHQLPIHEAPRRLREFSVALRLMFGSGAGIIERKIALKLCEKLGVTEEPSLDTGLEAFVESLKNSLSIGQREVRG